uniref:Uncharacterized protein n=1 Tax=Arundo donax TaxID=35708 RepID=A0A0A8YB49_ARUDO
MVPAMKLHISKA